MLCITIHYCAPFAQYYILSLMETGRKVKIAVNKIGVTMSSTLMMMMMMIESVWGGKINEHFYKSLNCQLTAFISTYRRTHRRPEVQWKIRQNGDRQENNEKSNERHWNFHIFVESMNIFCQVRASRDFRFPFWTDMSFLLHLFWVAEFTKPKWHGISQY